MAWRELEHIFVLFWSIYGVVFSSLIYCWYFGDGKRTWLLLIMGRKSQEMKGNLGHNSYYYSFKIFRRFRLAKILCIFHHNQLMSTKFGRILRYVKNYVHRAAKLPDYWTVNREDLGTRLSCFSSEHTNKKKANYWLKP